MKNNFSPEMPFCRMVEICAAAAGLLALLVLLGWFFGRWEIGALGPEYVPMAPSTAWLMILLSSGVLLQCRQPSKKVVLWFSLFAVFTVVVVALLVWVKFLFGYETPVERWLAPTTARLGDIPIGRMSPLTASAFLSLTLAFLFELPPFGHRQSSRQIASLLALITFLTSLVVLLSYLAGTPLLYDRQTIPIAVLTAVSFALLSLSILTAAAPDTWPLSSRATAPGEPSPPSSLWFVRGPLAAFLFLAVTIGIAVLFT